MGIVGAVPARALPDGLALTPPMGFNNWNATLASGLADSGVVTSHDPAKTLCGDVTRATFVRLTVTDAGRHEQRPRRLWQSRWSGALQQFCAEHGIRLIVVDVPGARIMSGAGGNAAGAFPRESTELPSYCTPWRITRLWITDVAGLGG